MEQITWNDFERIELRVGTILEAFEFPEARRPAYKVKVDFGEFGIKMSSAQITKHYTLEELPGKQIVGVVNFPKKQIGKFMSEFLVTGFADENGDIVLTTVQSKVPNGSKLI
ncbi:tRNA-binding protein [Pedobacter sp. KBS0701]|uniref:tRNA-binding protein n=1 Tax=Pedobacter sp. KBS0701 TaxID=2578106 RepID=UPI00110E60B3|nr:tRNA-binding protein [Pedobacter sp. KBS0701]QDW27051.1 tRNA-binding protein [Pedobacter sp. KBS0701]